MLKKATSVDEMSSQSDWMEEPDIDIDIDLSDRTFNSFTEEPWYHRLRDKMQDPAMKKKLAIGFGVAALLVALISIAIVLVFLISSGKSVDPPPPKGPISRLGNVPLLSNYILPPGFYAFVFADGLKSPRGMWIDPGNNDVLVVDRSSGGRISVLWDADGDGVSGLDERTVLIDSGLGLNHAVIVKSGYLYASSQSTVYRWPYVSGARTKITTPAEIVVQGMETGGHSTRTLMFDKSNLLYVQSGSGSNVDRTPTRSLIRRFDLSSGIPSGGFNYTSGNIFAIGLRNEVGLRTDADGRIWGVENGCDNLQRVDLGGDIHFTNPAEEINLFIDPKNSSPLGKSGYNSTKTRFYGYPYCWSEGYLPEPYSKGPVEQWAHPDFMEHAPIFTDEWCRDPENVVKPMFGLPAHTAPLDLYFYYGKAFPSDFVGDMFVALHGSWNNSPPSGYKVVRVRFNETKLPYAFESFMEYNNTNNDFTWTFRPSGLALRRCPWKECLLISSDQSSTIYAVTYLGRQ
eukprot:TRINITY_DN4362_c0_g1_i1.p1 TRINITY_DN4362_c0_g1~~TRINITY_DN4362_c0_g1_i1.p1  ORF type:complete len:514 (+),score=58.92 TRINITY_DN4362_c0_g1_i1:79-1620(+)